MIRITSTYFVCGIVLHRHINPAKGFINRCAPIVNYMKHWSPVQIKCYCDKKGWQFEIL